MAAPTVRGTSTPTLSTDMVPAVSVTLPTRVAGDLLLAFVSSDSLTTPITRTETTTWAVLYEESSAVTTRHACFARIATNDANDALTVGATNAQDGVITILVVTTGTHAGGVGGANVVLSAQATGSSATADPPNVDGGYVNDWLAVAHVSVAMTATGDAVSTAPTNYTTGAVLTKSASSTTSVGFGLGYRALTAAQTENPGTFGNTSRAWQSKTLLVPAPLSASGNAVTATVTGAATNAVGSPTVFANSVTATVTGSAANPTTEVWITFTHGASTATTITVTGLTNTVNYDFRVAAVNSVGTGPWSSTANSTPVGGGDVNANPVTANVTASATNPGIGQSPPSVAAVVTFAGTNPTTKLSANPSSVTATVTAAAANAVGQVAGNASATSVTATVTVDATNATSKLSANPPAVTATVTASATNPTVTRLSNGSAVTATVTALATNPTNKLSANPPSVYALVTVAAANALGSVPSTLRYPASISGRKLLDQNGDVILIKTFSSWGMAENLSNADITTALTGIAADGFNSVTVAFGGPAAFAGDWHRYTNQAGQNYWTGTPWASSLGAAWASEDWLISEAARLGMFVNFSLFVAYDGQGGGEDMEAVTDADMYNAGVAVATRYLAATNIVWHVELDTTDDPASTRGHRVEAFFHGVNDTEGASTRPVRWLEPNNPSTTNSQGWFGTTHFNATINTGYTYAGNNAETVEGWYADLAGVPIGDCEPLYDGHGTVDAHYLRGRTYAVFLEGGCVINYGHEDWWPFGLSGLYSEGLTWQDVPAHSHTLFQKYCWALMDAYVTDATWAPSAFVTGGAGSIDAKVSTGNSDSAAIAFFPDSRGSITVNTTLLAGTGNVRLRWYDPTTTATYTTIAASEAQNASRAVTHPGNGTNSAGDDDWVLVVDLLSASASANPVTATVTGSAANATVTVSSSASSVAATVTVAAANPTVNLSSNPPSIFAAVTLTATNPTVTRLSNASAVTATVIFAAANPVGHGDATASAVFAAVTVTASNAVGQTSAAGSANSVAALVTVDATNPTVKVSSASSSVSATVTVAASNPTVTRLSNGNAVTATVTAAGFNPTTKLTANPPSVYALVTVTANNAVGQVNAGGSANAVTATVVVAAANPTVTRLSNAGALTAGVTAAAANATTKLTASIVAIWAAVLAEAFNASSIRLGLRASTTSVRIASATVAATLTSSSGTDSITSATATEDIS